MGCREGDGFLLSRPRRQRRQARGVRSPAPGRPIAAGWAAAPPAGRGPGGRGARCRLARVPALPHPRRAPRTRPAHRAAPARAALRRPPGEAWQVQLGTQLGPVGVGEGRRRGWGMAQLGLARVVEGPRAGLGFAPERRVRTCSLTTPEGDWGRVGVGVLRSNLVRED